MRETRNFRMTSLIPILFWLMSAACAASHHPTAPSSLGEPSNSGTLRAVIEEPGPIEFRTVKAADWVVARGGMINLDHPKAIAAGLEDGDEPIGIFFHVLRHPEFGTFIVDTGVESGFRDSGGNDRVSFLVESAMNTDALTIHVTTAEWIRQQPEPLAGVFLTHLHLDHVMGLPDVPRGTPVYVGPGEPSASNFLNLFSRGTIDRMIESADALQVWPFEADADRRFAGVVDVFGDGSVWAIHVPGHSPGSTAFLVRTTSGSKLLVGDASHTRWGWENGVEPGSFSLDQPRSRESLAGLRDLAREFPDLEVLLGHQ
jgi:glyoxylase-like metal-dependent hydrolase (beta-lactamase superfamily II)